MPCPSTGRTAEGQQRNGRSNGHQLQYRAIAIFPNICNEDWIAFAELRYAISWRWPVMPANANMTPSRIPREQVGGVWGSPSRRYVCPTGREWSAVPSRVHLSGTRGLLVALHRSAPPHDCRNKVAVSFPRDQDCSGIVRAAIAPLDAAEAHLNWLFGFELG